MSERNPLLRRENIIKLQRLLNMQYKPSEIADEIGVSVYTVYRTYITSGAPHTRSKNGDILINGVSFREWAESIAKAKKQKKYELSDSEGWCMRCNKPVVIKDPLAQKVNRYIGLIKGICPNCGIKVNRAIAIEKIQTISG